MANLVKEAEKIKNDIEKSGQYLD